MKADINIRKRFQHVVMNPVLHRRVECYIERASSLRGEKKSVASQRMRCP